MSKELSLPLDAVTQKLAFIGRTGSGKTYAATKLAELFGEAGAQFIALDPVGKWWSLRLQSDGKTPGLDVPVFGGLHGDLPLEPLMGARIADLIVDRQISAVLDVSQFEHNTDKARFAEAFATRLFYRKKSAPSAVHLFVEEAQEFIPQNPQGEEKRMLGAFERIIKLGRNFGIGASLISQRPQEVNKKALNQTECLFVFQTTGVHERKAIDAWIADKGIDEDIAALLPALHVGEARVWSPSWLRVSLTTKIGEKLTFDASATPKVGARKVEVKSLTPIDIAEITKSLADVVERAKADDRLPKAR
jgi:DNA helicase HerA-like ATPase